MCKEVHMGSRMPKLGTSGSERGGICEDYRLLTSLNPIKEEELLIIEKASS